MCCSSARHQEAQVKSDPVTTFLDHCLQLFLRPSEIRICIEQDLTNTYERAFGYDATYVAYRPELVKISECRISACFEQYRLDAKTVMQ